MHPLSLKTADTVIMLIHWMQTLLRSPELRSEGIDVQYRQTCRVGVHARLGDIASLWGFGLVRMFDRKTKMNGRWKLAHQNIVLWARRDLCGKWYKLLVDANAPHVVYQLAFNTCQPSMVVLPGVYLLPCGRNKCEVIYRRNKYEVQLSWAGNLIHELKHFLSIWTLKELGSLLNFESSVVVFDFGCLRSSGLLNMSLGNKLIWQVLHRVTFFIQISVIWCSRI